MTFRLLGLVALLATSCDRPTVVGVEGQLLVEPTSITAHTWVGHPLEQHVSLRSTGRRALSVVVTATAGVSLPVAAAVIEPGETVDLTLVVLADRAGPIEQSLLVTTDVGSTVAVPVTGSVDEVPSCEVPGSCRRVEFVPGAGCVERDEADGTSCEASCLVDATCQQGHCLGAQRSCDDGDACTADSCQPGVGCLHEDSSARCAEPCDGGQCEASCRVARCDRTLGCVLDAAADGTRCGTNDCTTTHACFSGQCESRPSTVGSVCSEATPCSHEGRCTESNACVAAQVPMQPRWRIPIVDDALLVRATTSDHLLVRESNDAGVSLVAYDVDGFERWRSSRFANARSTTAMYVEAEQLVAVFSNDWARGLDARTGVERWFTPLQSQIPANNPGPTGKFSYPIAFTTLPAAGQVAVAYLEGNDSHTSWLFGLDAATGAQRWRVMREGHLSNLVGVDGEHVVIGSAPCWAPASWNARFDSTGTMGWNLFHPAVPSLSSGTSIWLQGVGNGALAEMTTSTGAVAPAATPDRALLFAAPLLYVQNVRGDQTVSAYDTRTGQTAWSAGPLPLEQAFLTSNREVLALTSSRVTLTGPAGQRWSCPLPNTAPTRSALLGGRLVVHTTSGIAAYDVGETLAPSGWSVSGRGTSANDLRAH